MLVCSFLSLTNYRSRKQQKLICKRAISQLRQDCLWNMAKKQNQPPPPHTYTQSVTQWKYDMLHDLNIGRHPFKSLVDFPEPFRTFVIVYNFLQPWSKVTWRTEARGCQKSAQTAISCEIGNETYGALEALSNSGYSCGLALGTMRWRASDS